MSLPAIAWLETVPWVGHHQDKERTDMTTLCEDNGKSLSIQAFYMTNVISRYSILPAISLDGVLHLDILTCSWTAEEFWGFVGLLLDRMNPYPLRNSVIVCDNASAHHFEDLREMVEERYVWFRKYNLAQSLILVNNSRGCKLRYLPAYSPDFNPIEEGFSLMKAWIRSNNQYVLAELTGEDTCDPYTMLWQAVFESMTPEKIIGWYRDCGYVV